MCEKYYLELETFGLGEIVEDELYLNRHRKNGDFTYNNKNESAAFQTQFTEKEIDKFGLRFWVANGTIRLEKVQ
ncbi:hypothetical protein [Macrococcus sp. DPC7161]|uniref:hypothetical protein n=1 Tax=Macrococcus sp. DPC7161 TaxID=2507060 RepID=UPI00100A74F7|nr:hypothetical protein [Macrococcus sp. DPC7161]RXK19055.1 hypothetical protein ER639_01710 [Macrococcus sp. DPC7161]